MHRPTRRSFTLKRHDLKDRESDGADFTVAGLRVARSNLRTLRREKGA
jgi:hypothetical protein